MRDVLPPRSLVLTWLALLALVASTLGFSFVPMGVFNLITALTISVVKTTLVLTVFMKLHRASTMTRVAAAAGLFWLALLFTLTATDYFTRGG